MLYSHDLWCQLRSCKSCPLMKQLGLALILRYPVRFGIRASNPCLHTGYLIACGIPRLWWCLQTRFTPHPEFSQVASSLGQDAQVVIECAMQAKCGRPKASSAGPLCCLADSSQLLEVSEEAFRKTEASYLATLVCICGEDSYAARVPA